MTYRDAVLVLVDLFSEHVTRPVCPPGTAGADRIRSHYGSLELAGTTVELDHERRGYRELGREERVALIEAHR